MQFSGYVYGYAYITHGGVKVRKDYYDRYADMLLWMTTKELLHEYIVTLVPWRRREHEMVQDEIESRSILW